MAAEPKVYTRLTRNAGGFGTYSNLWLARDHLLIVTSTGYNETYARIMFGDIKAFFITPTGRRLWWVLTWGLIAAITGIRVLIAFGYGDPPIFSGIFFVLSLMALALNWAWGGGCRVQVMTGVQNTVVPSLVRMKKTRAVLAQLQPLIVAAQADRVAPPVAPVAATVETARAPQPVEPAAAPSETSPSS